MADINILVIVNFYLLIFGLAVKSKLVFMEIKILQNYVNVEFCRQLF